MLTETDTRLRDELAPDLEVLRQIGEGSTAWVYLALEAALRRPVAVKVMRPEFVTNQLACRRFEREAQSAASLSHRNVTTVYRVGRLSDSRPYIVMEFIEGRTLAQMMSARGPLPLGEVRSTMISLASALAAAHAKGIVHRDVNPSNIFIEKSTNRPVLSDFGIAGLVDSGSGTTTRVSRIGQDFGDDYASPEAIRSEPLTEQSDVYSLGVIGYEMVAGRRPFDHLNLAQKITAQLQDTPADVRTLRPDADPELARMLARCLSKEPEQRPRATDIAPMLENRAVAAHVPAPEGLGGFLAELKRRRVYHAIATYIAAAFILLQVAELVQPTIAFVDTFYDEIVAITFAGFPLALVLSWIYDVRQGRIQRTSDAPAQTASVWQSALPLAGLLVAILMAWLIWWLIAG